MSGNTHFVNWSFDNLRVSVLFCFVLLFWFSCSAQRTKDYLKKESRVFFSDNFINAVLAASYLDVSSIDSVTGGVPDHRGLIIEDNRTLNYLKSNLLNEHNYIKGVKRSCIFLPQTTINIGGTTTSRNKNECKLSFSDAFCPKIAFFCGVDKEYMEVSESGVRHLSFFFKMSDPKFLIPDSIDRGKYHIEEIEVQLVVLSYLLKTDKISLISELAKSDFFSIIHSSNSEKGKNFSCSIKFSDQAEVDVFYDLLNNRAIEPLQTQISNGKVRIINNK